MRWFLALFGCCLFGASSARAEYTGDWADDTYADGFYAATVNDSGGVLGQYCNTAKGTCFWLIALKTGCKEESRYPVLVNSDDGARNLEIYCDGEYKNGF